MTDYADGQLSAEQVDQRVTRCLSLDPHFTVPARLGALMVSTLRQPDTDVHRRLLQRGANADCADDWFPRAMVVSLHQDPTHPPDLLEAWQQRATSAEPSCR